MSAVQFLCLPWVDGEGGGNLKEVGTIEGRR
jgi:hypothetical protein